MQVALFAMCCSPITPSVAQGIPAQSATTVVITRDELPVAAAFEDAAVPVVDVAVTGVTRYAPADLVRSAVARELEARHRSTIAGAVEAIELFYREDGYLLAEAVASLDEATARLSIDVVEGHIERITIEGLRPKTSRQVERYLSPLLNRSPLRDSEFERAFLLASDLTGVLLRSEFAAEPGARGFHLKVTGTDVTSTGSITVDNVPLGDENAVRGYANQEFYGVAVGGDMLRLFGVYSREPGGDDALAGELFYRGPVGEAGTYVEAFGGNVYSQRQFAELKTHSEQRGVNVALAVGHPIVRDLHNYLYVIGEYTYTDAQSRLDGSDIDSTAQVARLYLVQGHTRPDGDLVQWSLQVAHGARPDRSATEPPDGDKRFNYARAGFGSVTALPFISDHAYLRFEATGQWTSDSLPEVERMGLGFQPNLRGYTPWEVEGDRGYGATLELSYIKPVVSDRLREFMPFVFVDAGAVDLTEPEVGMPSSEQIYSAGAGARFILGYGFSASGWVGVPLKDASVSEAGDPSFYVRVSRGW
jgi:hemolysin activation/secretion protein